MPKPEKKKRNKQLIALRLEDPKKWSFSALGKRFKITKITAFQVYQRDLTKYATVDKS